MTRTWKAYPRNPQFPVYSRTADGTKTAKLVGLQLSITEERKDERKPTSKATAEYIFYNGTYMGGDAGRGAFDGGDVQRMYFHLMGRNNKDLELWENPIKVDLPSWKCSYNKYVRWRKAPKMKHEGLEIEGLNIDEIENVVVTFDEEVDLEPCYASM